MYQVKHHATIRSANTTPAEVLQAQLISVDSQVFSKALQHMHDTGPNSLIRQAWKRDVDFPPYRSWPAVPMYSNEIHFGPIGQLPTSMDQCAGPHHAAMKGRVMCLTASSGAYVFSPLHGRLVGVTSSSVTVLFAKETIHFKLSFFLHNKLLKLINSGVRVVLESSRKSGYVTR